VLLIMITVIHVAYHYLSSNFVVIEYLAVGKYVMQSLLLQPVDIES